VDPKLFGSDPALALISGPDSRIRHALKNILDLSIFVLKAQDRLQNVFFKYANI
jgi:hypothetical protein